MKQRMFGPTAREVPTIGQGTWYLDEADWSSAIAALRRGVELGMTHIDTAEMYGDAESLLGKAMVGIRDQIFLVSKILPEHASRGGTIVACERSLARLRTDHLDCYLLHWRGQHPLEDTIAGFEMLQRDGKIRSWGVSNFDVSDLELVRHIAGSGQLACNQVLYHLEQRAIEHAVLPWCERNGVAVTAYSPFGHGRFPGLGTKGGRELLAIARTHQKTPRQVALAFLTRRPALFAIPKASSPEHVEENALAGTFCLDDAAITRIDAAFPLGPRPPRLPML
jgi:diketogulonate reductase-like aldo/keto reductase